ncbi:MAG: TonB-dependent receptor [Bacteroidales bacterium]|jgi:TonB-linked SusC/RagA family outer membrane protein|nr:TonB-dependent receptor [Bacteroidales bacterium]
MYYIKKSVKNSIRRASVLFALLMTVCLALPAQQQPSAFNMGGTVYDETGETLPGVSVFIKNKISIGTATDMNGKFSIKAQRGDMIVFHFIGYADVEFLVTEQKQDIEIRFTESAQQLEEVVVTGLGQTQRRISSVAAIATVDVKELQQPVASVANLLGGRVAGVVSLQSSGEPGKNISDFWIRGIGTFGANASALVLIDGLEGDINSLDPADIESFSILKDASATAVYGVRGANGVVLITTKRGQTGKLTITGRANFTLSHLKRVPEYLRAFDYANLVNEAMLVRNEIPIYSAVELDIIQDGSDPDLYPDVSWQDEILNRNSWKQSYYVSARGGAQMAKYFISMGGSSETAAYKYDKNSAYAANSGYNTYTYRLNLDLELSPTTTLFFGTDGFLSIKNNPGIADTDYIWDAQARLNPTLLPVRYSNGQFSGVGTGNTFAPTTMINHMGRRTEQEYKGKATIAVNQDLSFLLKGLRIRAQGAYDLTSWFSENRSLQPALYQAVGRNNQGELITILRQSEQNISYGRGTNQFRKYHFESTLNYDMVFSDVHRVGALVYYYLSDEKKASDGYSNLSSIPKRYQGVSGRLTYGFKDTYMIDLNFGYTGSENFKPGSQYGFFPSVALGWVLSGYDYVKNNMPWVNLFKIRGSYGTVGNDRISGDRRFPYLTTVIDGTYTPWQSPSATYVLTETTIGADNLQWEKASKANVGIEGRFMNDQISFVVDVFNDVRNGIFMPRVQVPNYAGLMSMPYGNVGKLRSYGTDGNVSYLHVLNKDMNFTIRANYTFAKNDVKDWEEANPKYPYQSRAGYSHNSVRGFQSLGLFKDEYDIQTSPIQSFGTVMPGDIKYRDINGDGVVDLDDKVPLTHLAGAAKDNPPMLMFGFGGEFAYKQFTVGIMFKGTGNTDVIHVGDGYGYGYMPFYSGQQGNVLSLANDPANRWIPREYCEANGIPVSYAENPNARFPRLYYGQNANNTQTSDFWKTNARYLRLQEITINYNFKRPALQKVGISSIDFQLMGTNLYVWDKIKIFDPEQAYRNGNVYPIPTTFTLQVYINM